MALSSIVKKTCGVCGKVAVEKSRINFGTSKLITLECGHMTSEDVLAVTDYSSIVSSDNRKLMPYQVDGVKFIETSNARCLIGDEQGLGKTIQMLAAIKLHQDKLAPVLIITKSTIKLQWMWEVIRWTGNKKVQVIQTSKELAIPGFDIYITTYDLIKSEKIFEFVQIKTLVLDECQAIKNHLSGRAKAVQKIAKNCEHVVGLSGTPIKNNAGEYFTILNLLQPSRFPTYQGYLDRHCDSYGSMYGHKVGGLKNPEMFRSMTEDFIIRRTKKEVLKDLPPMDRRFYHVELGKKFEGAYKEAIKELEELMYKDDSAMTAKIAIMTRMREIAGLSKVAECVDYLTDWVLSSEAKIVVFVHHHSVASLLKAQIDTWLASGDYPESLHLHSGLDGDSRAELVKQFKESNSRILIASTLAAGEGLNLQFCSNAIMLERQWNPANEEQAEARFHRFGQLNPVTITYMIVTETIDEYFTELVEQKRAIVASTLDGQTINWDSNSLLKDLADVMVAKGLKKWTL